MRNKFLLSILGLAFIGFGCKRNPIDRLTNPVPQGAVNQTSGVFVIYDDDIKTGGGLGLIPFGNDQAIDVQDNTSPARTLNDIRYSWDGQDVPNNGTPQHLFAGFLLPVTAQIEQLPTAQPRNFLAAGYTKVKFFIRGTMSDRTAVRIEGPDDGDLNTPTPQVNSRRQGDASAGDFVLTDSWQEVTIPVPPLNPVSHVNDFSKVKSFLTVSFQFSQPAGTTLPGGGGVIYMDDIRYVQ